MHGVHSAGRRHIGADALRTDALLQRLARHPKAEVLPAVRRVQEHAALLRLHNLRHHSAVLADDAPRIAAEQMRYDVPRLQQRQQFPRERGSALAARKRPIADMHHQSHAALGRRLLSQSHHLYAHSRHAWPYRPYLDALYQRLVFADNPNRLFNINIFPPRCIRLVAQSRARYVQHAKYAGCGARDNIARESAECVRPRAARVHQRGNAGADARQVGIDAVLVHALIHMRMQINQPRRYHASARVNHPPRARRIYVRRYLRHNAPRNRNIHLRVDALRGINNPPAFQQQVRHCNSPPQIHA